MHHRAARYLLLLLAFSPALLPLWQIQRFGVDVPYWDQFDDDVAGLHLKAHNGSLTFADLAAQHNEHRILVPRLIFLAVDHVTHGNMIAEMLVGWTLAAGTSLLLLRLGTPARTFPPDNDKRGPLFWWFLANLLLFSPAQYENWLWGMSIQNLLPMFWIAAGLVAATSGWSERTRVALVVLFTALATWSSGNGLLGWVLCGGVLLWAPDKREFLARYRSALVLLAAALLFVGPYFVGMAPPNHRGLTPYDSTIAAKLHYALAFAGAPFAFTFAAPPVVVATVAGAVSYASLALCGLRFLRLWRRGEDPALCRRVLPWFAVAGFAVGSGLIAACARAGIGPLQAVSSRYVTFAVLLPLALVPLFDLLKPWRLFLRRTAPVATADTMFGTAAATTVVLLALAAVPPALDSSAETQVARRQTRAAVQLSALFPGHPMVTAMVFPDAAVARRNLAGLDAIGFLRPRLLQSPEVRRLATRSPYPAEQTGRLERAWESGPDELTLTGWALLPDAVRPADAVLICTAVADGEPTIVEVAPVSLPRPDLAAHGPAAAQCGWVLRAAAATLVPRKGAVAVSAWAFDADRGVAYPLGGVATLGR